MIEKGVGPIPIFDDFEQVQRLQASVGAVELIPDVEPEVFLSDEKAQKLDVLDFDWAEAVFESEVVDESLGNRLENWSKKSGVKWKKISFLGEN